MSELPWEIQIELALAGLDQDDSPEYKEAIGRFIQSLTGHQLRRFQDFHDSITSMSDREFEEWERNRP